MNGYNLASEFLKYLNSLSPNTDINGWTFTQKTDSAYGSPTGAWQTIGFDFTNGTYSFIIRSIPNYKGYNESYIVIESHNLKGQLYNMHLDKPKILQSSNGSTSLLESYIMTVGSKQSRAVVQGVFQRIGVHSNIIVTISDKQPDWSLVLTSLLQWGIHRVAVKKLLRNQATTVPSIESSLIMSIQPIPLNQILYGPPGTGKTYHTINKALEIIDVSTMGKTRKELKEIFDKKVKEKQIVFTTFHQSMSYEDFIEGIKPQKPKAGKGMTYDIENGIFKSVCQAALSNKANSSVKKEKQNYVLIIDEINRGNVSQIFGELITLIEEDKRLGKAEALEVVLPYSKERFGVPENVYIIGTMNTADRSVEALDTALRRRFHFQEMLPDTSILPTPEEMVYSLLWRYETADRSDKKYLYAEKNVFDFVKSLTNPGDWRDVIWNQMKKDQYLTKPIDAYFSDTEFEPIIDLSLLLTTINLRLEKLISRDHQVGHAYFTGLRDSDHPLATLKSIFQHHIIPLLQEYFYGDFGKIGLVLGAGFVEQAGKEATTNLFADFSDYDVADLMERPVYRIPNVLDMGDDLFLDALQTLLKIKKKSV